MCGHENTCVYSLLVTYVTVMLGPKTQIGSSVDRVVFI